MFHVGHLDLIRQLAERFERVVVAVVRDEDVHGIAAPVIPFAERFDIVASVRGVDLVVAADAELIAGVGADQVLAGEQGIPGWIAVDEWLTPRTTANAALARTSAGRIVA